MKQLRLARGILTDALALGHSACMAQTKTLWLIYWISDRLPREGYWTKPMTATDSMHCPLAGDAKVSICPRPKKHPDYPYDQGKLITIVGCQIMQILSTPTATGYTVVGSYHYYGGRDGADVFAVTGGVGTNRSAGSFPAGMAIPQGTKDRPDAHIDVYGVCDSGTQQAVVNIFYTAP